MKIRDIVHFGFGPMLMIAIASPASATDNLADHIQIFGMPGLPARDGKPALPSHEILTQADLDIVQGCKDAVMTGRRYEAHGDEHVPPPPGLISPLLVDHVLMLNRCIEAAGLKGVYVVASSYPVQSPQIR